MGNKLKNYIALSSFIICLLTVNLAVGSTINDANEKAYLQKLMSSGGGTAAWAANEARKLGYNDILDSEKSYLETLVKMGGGYKSWAIATAKNLGLNDLSEISQPTQPQPQASVLKLGMSGNQVTVLQSKLNKLGYKISVDGIFGNQTLYAIKSFQGRYGLSTDGVVGPQTLEKINQMLSGTAENPTTIDPNNEKAYLQKLMSSGGGTAAWAANEARKLGYNDILDSEKSYLETLVKMGGGYKSWAIATAKNLGFGDLSEISPQPTPPSDPPGNTSPVSNDLKVIAAGNGYVTISFKSNNDIMLPLTEYFDPALETFNGATEPTLNSVTFNFKNKNNGKVRSVTYVPLECKLNGNNISINYRNSSGQTSVNTVSANGYIISVQAHNGQAVSYWKLSNGNIESVPNQVVEAFNNTLEKGMIGGDVYKLQKALNKLGYDLSVDGNFGPATQTAIMDLQKKYGFTPDGIVDYETGAKIEELLYYKQTTDNTPSINPQITDILSYGANNTEVDLLQTYLKKLGYNLSIDGDFGPETKAAVIDLQKKYGLVPDGVVGATTENIISNLLNEQQKIQPSTNLVSFVKDYEGGFQQYPYKSLDYQNQTIGYGHVVKPTDHLSYPISKSKAESLLEGDLLAAAYGVSSIFNNVRLNQHQFDALTDFAFNCGVLGLSQSTLAQDILSGNNSYDVIRKDFSMWDNVNGNPSLGLYDRRIDEWKMFEFGDYMRHFYDEFGSY